MLSPTYSHNPTSIFEFGARVTLYADIVRTEREDLEHINYYLATTSRAFDALMHPCIHASTHLRRENT